MRERKYRYFMGDFETSVYKGQEFTEVWASACVELYTEDVLILHSIEEQFNYFEGLKSNIIVYYHNLKFDGTFWLSYLLAERKMEQAFIKHNEDGTEGEWCKLKDMPRNSFSYCISDRGMWYEITVKFTTGYVMEIRDSLKLLPFSVKRIGKGFKTKHQKLDMEYEGFRYAGCAITDEEAEYIKNDVLVVKEALEIMFDEGHRKLTIGSCCLAEYERLTGKEDYAAMFPNLYDELLDGRLHKYKTIGEWVRKSYKGGWCYLAKGKEGLYRPTHGTTADVNSLYPSMMSSESGNPYPVGKPKFWAGNFIPDEARGGDKYFFVRIKTRFYVRKGYLPFIQIKGNPLYKGTECLATSDVLNRKTGEYHDTYTDEAGNERSTRVELTLTMTDYKLVLEHYELVDFEILDGCWFYAQAGIFDAYIERYKKQKLESTGAKRELAKLFLNNLYGKMASSTDNSFKVAYLGEGRELKFYTVASDGKRPGYIPVGSAITSYARNFTIRAAQKNYHGADKPGFIYADTDSIHCNLPPEQIVGIKVHEKNFCCWKLESCWDEAMFVRQKTYIEHVTHEDLQPLEKPWYNIKCAGMPEKCKELFLKSMEGHQPADEERKEMTGQELEFLSVKRDLGDFKVGLSVPGKLRPVRIRGGTLLVDTPYQMHERW